MKKPSIHGWVNAEAVGPLQVKEGKTQSSMTTTVSLIDLQKKNSKSNTMYSDW